MAERSKPITWSSLAGSTPLVVLLSKAALGTADFGAVREAGFEPLIRLIETGERINIDEFKSAAVFLVEVNLNEEASVNRFEQLIQDCPGKAVIAAASDLTVEAIKLLLRSGATDVISVPVVSVELVQVLSRIAQQNAEKHGKSSRGRIISIVGSVGGVGATALLTQLSTAHARSENSSAEICLLDLDLQFGSAALYLGLAPALTLGDILEAGKRADGSLLRAVAAKHQSGLSVIAAPVEIMPIESLDSDQVLATLDLAASEYAAVFVDLPANWTNWSVSALASSNLILLVVELSIASLHQARRQIEMIKQQGLSDVPLLVVVNRVENKLFRSIDLSDVERALGEPVFASVSSDPASFGSAIDQGIPLTDLNGRSRVAKDIVNLAGKVAASLEKQFHP